MIAAAVVIIWAISGIFHYSDTWQLVISTGATIVTFHAHVAGHLLRGDREEPAGHDRQSDQLVAEERFRDSETKDQIARLEKVFQMHGVVAKSVDCPAIDGILKEASEVAGDVDDKQALDAALIAAAQAVEHYEITRYGTLIAWAKKAGLRRLRLRLAAEPR
jgi:Domain of unknown function (DUF892)/Low affinity iron permease